MIFVVLAMGRGASGCRAYRACPVSRSSRMAARALIAGGWSEGAGVVRAVGNGDGEPTGGTGVGGGVGVRPAAPAPTATHARTATSTATGRDRRTRPTPTV